MLFSIIIPVYNVENYIEQCLDSIISQAIQCKYGAEIILVDDGSTDSSGTICDRYKNTYRDLIKVIHNKNQGLILTRRCGLRNAQGDYVINCDSDDKLALGALDKLAVIIKEFSPDVIFYNMDFYDGMSQKPYYTDVFTIDKNCKLTFEDVIKFYFLSNIPVVTSMASKTIKRECFNEKKDYLLFANSSMGEDTLQSAEVYENAKSFIYVNDSLYIYRIGSGMTSKFDKQYFMKFKDIFQYIENYDYIKTNLKYVKWIKAKLLNTAGRAIVQSRYCKTMSLKERREYIYNIMSDESLAELLPEIGIFKNLIEKRYYIIIKMYLLGMSPMIHALLDAKNKIEMVKQKLSGKG